MAIIIKNIVQPKQLEAAQTDQYIAQNCKTRIDKFTLTNTSGSNVVVSVNLIPSPASASAANAILFARTIAPSECYTCPELVSHILEPNAKISTLASAASSITINVSGVEIT